MRRLLLLGGGHAHIQVVKAFGAAPVPAAEVILVDRNALALYSGMLPGLIAGHYSAAQCQIDLVRLCRAAKVRFVQAEVVRIDLAAGRVACRERADLAFDLLSIDTGSTPPTADVPGAARYAIPIKPPQSFLARGLAPLDAQAAAGKRLRIALVGAGAGGVEVALAVEHRLHGDGGVRHELHLITDGTDILPQFPPGVRERAERLLAARAIRVRRNARCIRVGQGSLTFQDGSELAVEHVLWITGAAPAPMFSAAGLRVDERGFVCVDRYLRSLSHPRVFAAGDVAAMVESPRPKAGVFAVRQGPILAANLRRALSGQPLLPYHPQTRFLVLLSAGRRYAIATRGGWSVQGAWVWHWKDWIDRRFVRAFDAPAVTTP